MVTVIPLAESRWAEARWLILAPHPDDETLGAGALIATTAAAGRLAGVVFLTDGGASHPHPDELSRLRLTTLRRAEAEAALAVLSEGRPIETIFLEWPDAQPHDVDGVTGLVDATQLAAFCTERKVTALAVTALHEPHCDHVAAARLGRAVVDWAGPGVSLFEYLVWADGPPPRAREAVETDPVSPGLRMKALDCHRSQLTDLLGQGFRLDPDRLIMPERDRLFLWAGTDAA